MLDRMESYSGNCPMSLSPNDLANMSFTCSKFKQAAIGYFRRNHKSSEIIKISAAANDVNFIFKRGHYEKYELRFRSMIKNIELYVKHNKAVPGAFQFMLDNCSKEIRWLKIYGFDDLRIDYDQIKQNAEQLSKIETLILERCIILGNTFSKIFTDLKTLSIDDLPAAAPYEAWLDDVYPKLTTLLILRPTKKIDLTNMLRSSPALNTIYTNCAGAIQSIFLTKRKLLRVDVRFWNEIDFLTCVDSFSECGKQMNITILNINFPSAISFRALTKLMHSKHVNGLHYVLDLDNIEFFTQMTVQPNLKELCLRIEEPWTQNVFNAIARCHPNLKKLRLYPDYTIFNNSDRMSLKETLDHLIGRIGPLEHLYVDLVDKITKNDADKLRAQHSKRFKSTLNIYLNTCNDIDKLHKSFKNDIVFMGDDEMRCSICAFLDYQGELKMNENIE